MMLSQEEERLLARSRNPAAMAQLRNSLVARRRVKMVAVWRAWAAVAVSSRQRTEPASLVCLPLWPPTASRSRSRKRPRNASPVTSAPRITPLPPAMPGDEHNGVGLRPIVPLVPLCGASCELSPGELEEHIADLRTGRHRFLWRLAQLLKRLMEHKKNRGVFNVAVNPKQLNLPTYFDVISRPMDLGSVKGKLESGEYDQPAHFAADVRLVFENALRFNPQGHYVWLAAQELMELFEVEPVCLGSSFLVVFERLGARDGVGTLPPRMVIPTVAGIECAGLRRRWAPWQMSSAGLVATAARIATGTPARCAAPSALTTRSLFCDAGHRARRVLLKPPMQRFTAAACTKGRHAPNVCGTHPREHTGPNPAVRDLLSLRRRPGTALVPKVLLRAPASFSRHQRQGTRQG